MLICISSTIQQTPNFHYIINHHIVNNVISHIDSIIRIVSLFCGNVWFKSKRIIQPFQNHRLYIINQTQRSVLIL